MLENFREKHCKFLGTGHENDSILRGIGDLIEKINASDLAMLGDLQIVESDGETCFLGPKITKSGILILPAQLHTESPRRIKNAIAQGLAACVLDVPWGEAWNQPNKDRVINLAASWGAEPVRDTTTA